MKLRQYQQDAVDSVINFIKRSLEPCLIRAGTGAGKSLIVAEIARKINEISGGKKTLVLVPSKELVEQNYDKFVAMTNSRASIFSASAGVKCTKNSVVFATTGTVVNEVKKSRHRFAENYASVIIDEAHMTSRSMRSIIDKMREANNNIRIIGMTATPYRLLDGYIYRNELINGKLKSVPEGKFYDGSDEARKPMFSVLVYSITEPQLMNMGFLTPLVVGKHDSTSYDTSSLSVKRNGQFDSEEIKQTFENQRITKTIIDEVMLIARDRMSVIIFASTVDHAKEILGYLPEGEAEIVTAETPRAKREEIIERSKEGKLKYLVNMQTLTTGFDSSTIDTVVMMRATESVALLQQCVGRGLRLHAGKNDCLLLDYAKNIERHSTTGDIYSPIIESPTHIGNAKRHKFICPKCKIENEFSLKKEFEGYEYDRYGYIITPDGDHIVNPVNDMPIAVHSGQRCQNTDMIGGKVSRCDHYWNAKPCKKCGSMNSIQSKKCRVCAEELVDPNEKLVIEASTANNTFWKKAHCDTVTVFSASNNGSFKIQYNIQPHGKISVTLNFNHQNQWFKGKSKSIMMNLLKMNASTLKLNSKDMMEYIGRQDRPPFSLNLNKEIIFRNNKGYFDVKY